MFWHKVQLFLNFWEKKVENSAPGKLFHEQQVLLYHELWFRCCTFLWYCYLLTYNTPVQFPCMCGLREDTINSSLLKSDL